MKKRKDSIEINEALDKKKDNSRKEKRYEKPDFETSEVFESEAVTCGKCSTGGPVSQSACLRFKKTS